MELQDSDRELDHEQQQQRYVYGGGFMARTFGRVIDRLRGIEESVNTSTFGRVFRLDGSGHVGFRSPPRRMAMWERDRLLTMRFCLIQPEQIQDASFYTEIRAGLTTFATMAYIIAVNVREHSSSVVGPAC